VGVPLEAIGTGLSAVRGAPGRLQIKAGPAGSTLLDDTYNANPASLAAALRVLREFPGRHLLALGDMGELGPEAEALHACASRAEAVNVLREWLGQDDVLLVKGSRTSRMDEIVDALGGEA